jgi:cytochrome c553
MKSMRISHWLAGLCLLAAAAVGSTALAADVTPPGAIAKCEGCHGVTGESASPKVPRLNGQKADYIVMQFRNFRDPGMEDPHATAAMFDVAHEVDDASLAKIAAYFASQPPSQSQAAGAPGAAGRKLYENGDPANRIAACGSCHGPDAEGRGTIPRLAGQHGAYLKSQLERLRLGLRASGVMHPSTNSMSDAQIGALVSYLAGH